MLRLNPPIARFLNYAVASAFFLLAPVWSRGQMPPAPTPPPATEISAELGSCTADFHVTDLAGHPLYNAKVHTLIRYGFLSMRKLELEVGTNSAGRARFLKLPEQVKKPIVFDVTYQGQRAQQTYDPGTDCHPSYDVPLKVGEQNPK